MVNRFSAPLKQSMLDFNNWVNKVKRADSVTRTFGQNIAAIGGKMKSIGGKMTLGLTAPLALLGRSSLLVARDFESSMNMVGAVTRTKIGGQVTQDFIKLREEAKRLGAITIFTTQQVADGMQVLGLKGLDVNQIFGVMPKVLELATSAQMDIADAAAIATSIMYSQQLQAEDLRSVNDTLVSAFTRSSADLRSLGESFKYAGNITRVTGLSVQEAAAAFAMMSKQGIDATMAGTAMRTGMVRLAAPSKQMIGIMHQLGVKIFRMVDGKRVLRPFLDIVKEFERAGADAVTMTNLLGLRAGPGFATLIGQSAEMAKLISQMAEDTAGIGIAARIAQTQMTGLPKILAELAAAWEIVRIAFMESKFGQWVQDMLSKFTQWLRVIAQTNPDILAMAATLLAVVAVLGPLVTMMGFFVTGLGAIIANIGIIGTIAGVLTLIGIAIVDIIGLIKLIPMAWKATVDGIKTLGHELVEFFKYLPVFIQKVINTVATDVQNLVVGIADKIKGILPDFVVKWMGSGDQSSILDQARTASGNVPFVNNSSQTSVNIRVSTDEKSSAQIEKINRKGSAEVNVINDTFLGMGAAWGS
jgi:TP901 family phage tail tape measure protein